MIMQYQYAVSCPGSPRIPPFWAYRFYAWLLEQIPSDYGEWLHQQGEKPVSHFLYHDKQQDESIWQISLLSETAVSLFNPILSNLTDIFLNSESIKVQPKGVFCVEQPQQFMQHTCEQTDAPRQTKLSFLSTTTFRQNGNYTMFPQMRLILQSLINKWNLCYPEFLLMDEDAFNLLEQGLHITDYVLRSNRFPLKATKIPGFVGSIMITSRLSAPMEELWQLLLAFAPFSGIGVKTTLGMGGVAVNMP